VNQDFLIIGGGVSGLISALRLLEQGARVTVLESGAVGQESSWAGGGILSPLCPWNYSEAVNQLCNGATEKYAALVESLYSKTGVDPEIEFSGMLILPPFDRDAAQKWSKSNGVAYCDVGQECGVEEFFLLPNIAHVRNPRLVQALHKRVAQLGGHVVKHCAVSGIEVQDDMVQRLITVAGEFAADRYIVCAGAWSRQVLGEYALQLDIKPVRGQMLLFKFDAPPIEHIVLQDGMYLIPRRDGHLLVGSTQEDVGFDKSTTTVACDSLWQRAQLILPQLRDMPLLQHWSGLRPGSPHNIPTIGRHPALENLYINSGHFRYGVTMAPASATVLLNELNGVAQPFDVSPYRAGWAGN